MATYNTGTTANQTIVGRLNEANTFLNYGLGADTLTGGQLTDVFIMHADKDGVDMIDGGAGRDHVDYSVAGMGLSIWLSDSTNPGVAQFKVASGGTTGTLWHQAAQLRSIEDVTGSRFGDVISGNSSHNKLDGGQGKDELNGRAGNDELIGGEGDDKLIGGSGDDILNGGANNDEIYTGTNKNTVDAGTGDDTIILEFDHQSTTAYRDTIEGGTGNDTIMFSENLVGNYSVQVSLAGGTVSSSYYNGSTTAIHREANISGIENVNGTNFDDVFAGNGENNTLRGYDGRDVFEGGGGVDTMLGGNGNDTFVSIIDDQADVIYGDANADTVIYSSGSARSLQVTLGENGGMGTATTSRTSTSPNGATSTTITSVEDYLYNVENITGTSFADTITGNSANNELLGNGGMDTLRGGGGMDVLDGGAGRDVLIGGAQADTFRFWDLGIGVEGDQILDFQTGSDKMDFSGIFSNPSASHTSNTPTPAPEFIGSAAFSGDGSEMRVWMNSSGQRVVEVDLDGGGLGELDIQIFVTGQVTFTDFLF